VSRKLSLFPAMAALLLAGAGCYVPAPKVHKTVSMDSKVEIGEAESTQVSVALGVGKLTVTGGAEGLLDARFEYNISDWKPEVSYEVKEGLGRLTIEQPSTVVGATWPSNVRYEWDLKLSDKVPMDLDIEIGVGKLDLDTRGMNLRYLKVNAGLGEGRIDLSGTTTDLTADVEAGIGKLKLLLPSDIGVSVQASGVGRVRTKGLANDGKAWTNDGWVKSKVSLNVNIEGGIGEVEIEVVTKDTV